MSAVCRHQSIYSFLFSLHSNHLSLHKRAISQPTQILLWCLDPYIKTVRHQTKGRFQNLKPWEQEASCNQGALLDICIDVSYIILLRAQCGV